VAQARAGDAGGGVIPDPPSQTVEAARLHSAVRL
jgi:hypothetical protein